MLLGRSKLVCTDNDMTELQEVCNKTVWIEVYTKVKKNQHKIEVLQVDNFNCIWCFNQKWGIVLQRYSFAGAA